jgi:hypothetical protein
MFVPHGALQVGALAEHRTIRVTAIGARERGERERRYSNDVNEHARRAASGTSSASGRDVIVPIVGAELVRGGQQGRRRELFNQGR